MDNKLIGNEKNILFYNDEEGNTKVEVLLENEDVWLNTEALAALFNVKRPAITKHINNIYEDEELEEGSTCSKMEHMGNNGRQVYNTKYYNLDMIISIGFRVNSKKAIKFRTWANKIIKDYMVQGFALNDERFLKAKKSDQEYFKRLLERIKLIRTSERMFYQKITDIFAECSIDYDKNSDTAITFYKTIQNKFHYAITGNTAAEIVYKRVDSKKENMGLVELATVSFGQSFQITPIQLITTAASIINGGNRVTPHFAVRAVSSDRTSVHRFSWPVKEHIVSEETSASMRYILEQVVAEGSGKKAAVEGFRIGGKTATSEKLPRSLKKYISSFIGFAPADNPRVIALITIDEPQGVYYGGTIAAPVIADIFKNILPYLGIPEAVEETAGSMGISS